MFSRTFLKKHHARSRLLDSTCTCGLNTHWSLLRWWSPCSLGENRIVVMKLLHANHGFRLCASAAGFWWKMHESTQLIYWSKICLFSLCLIYSRLSPILSALLLVHCFSFLQPISQLQTRQVAQGRDGDAHDGPIVWRVSMKHKDVGYEAKSAKKKSVTHNEHLVPVWGTHDNQVLLASTCHR